MTKLNQMVAVVTGKKTRFARSITELYQTAQKETLYNGLAKTYRPKDENGTTYPDEVKHMELRASEVIKQGYELFADMWDAIATVDVANTRAVGDITVDGVELLKSVPLPHLLYMEKQLADVETFVRHIPTLSPTEEWHFDENQNAYVTRVSSSNRTTKVKKTHVAVPATKEHPAQALTYDEDEVVGTWDTRKFSGALPVNRKSEIIAKIAKLRDAVKMAREQANDLKIEQVKFSNKLLDFVFA